MLRQCTSNTCHHIEGILCFCTAMTGALKEGTLHNLFRTAHNLQSMFKLFHLIWCQHSRYTTKWPQTWATFHTEIHWSAAKFHCQSYIRITELRTFSINTLHPVSCRNGFDSRYAMPLDVHTWMPLLCFVRNLITEWCVNFTKCITCTECATIPSTAEQLC
jgi:hypothetical protein